MDVLGLGFCQRHHHIGQYLGQNYLCRTSATVDEARVALAKASARSMAIVDEVSAKCMVSVDDAIVRVVAVDKALSSQNHGRRITAAYG